MRRYSPIDPVKSFKLVEARIARDVKDGKLPGSRARAILDKAREAYRGNTFNREMERRGLLNAS